VIDFGHLPGYSQRMARYGTLMIVDDDPDVLTAARLLMRPHFQRVLTSETPDAIEGVMAADSVDVFLLDMNFAIGRNTGAEGLHWLERIRAADPDAVVVLMTAFGDLNMAVEAMRLGAADFVLKPWQNDKLVATLGVAAELRRSRATVSELATPPPDRSMIAESPAMQEVMRIIRRVAPTDANVLVYGENGTGKELVAEAIYRHSSRSDRVLVAVDLGAVSESLFESELFGHRKGAFTDAASDRAGRFQAANGGTLFLDEVANLPMASQTKLLRVLETREVVPLGSDQPVGIDVRLIAATNQPLRELVDEGTFREDLLFRINTIEIELPPLRARPEDIEPLARHFIERVARKYRLPGRSIGDDALAALQSYRWPGNVRELSHAIERAMILSDTGQLGAGDFELGRRDGQSGPDSLNLEDNERRLVERALAETGGNISHAAKALGITRAALYRRMEKFGL
jgi:DNA-binding NtrC family response regulator